MSPEQLVDITNLMTRVGIIGILVFVLWARLRGTPMWVEGGTYRKKEEECTKLSEENKILWQEKVADARKSESIAEAYIEIWEREHGTRTT